MKVVFITIQNPQEKLKGILKVSYKHFEKREPLLFLAPNEKAKEYIDTLLWKEPVGSFLPHVATDRPTEELIAITCLECNPNKAHTVFNLTAHPIDNSKFSFTTVYEFDDRTQPAVSKSRYKAYKEKGFQITLTS
ncbi:MAG: DNA polymerase III subunit chi [Candidatus Algichlamydia australiensis]|nr:DNA polymerase III subunit chi [Chlamydiales bacterium]